MHRLRVFENRVLRKTFEPKRDKVTGGWRKFHNEKFHNLYSSPYITRMIKLRRMKSVGHVTCMGETRNTYKILVGKPETIWKDRRGWDNSEMHLSETGLGVVDWIHLARDSDQWWALVNTVINLQVP
jgi:hypothetical protein